MAEMTAEGAANYLRDLAAQPWKARLHGTKMREIASLIERLVAVEKAAQAVCDAYSPPDPTASLTYPIIEGLREALAKVKEKGNG